MELEAELQGNARKVEELGTDDFFLCSILKEQEQKDVRTLRIQSQGHFLWADYSIFAFQCLGNKESFNDLMGAHFQGIEIFENIIIFGTG